MEYDRATGSWADTELANHIRGGGAEIAVSEPVLMEVLAAATDDRARANLRRLLTSFQWIPVDPVADFEGAAKISRRCRAAGSAPRGLVDCLVANSALRTGSRLMAAHRDFASIASVVPLQLVEP